MKGTLMCYSIRSAVGAGNLIQTEERATNNEKCKTYHRRRQQICLHEDEIGSRVSTFDLISVSESCHWRI